jgi:hypothetical protein
MPWQIEVANYSTVPGGAADRCWEIEKSSLTEDNRINKGTREAGPSSVAGVWPEGHALA